MECQPGEEVQLDFLRLVLSYSRKCYSEAAIGQNTETFIRCLENGLRSLGGLLSRHIPVAVISLPEAVNLRYAPPLNPG
jgi:transposase